MTWYRVRGSITVDPKAPLTLGGRRGLEGDGEGTVDVSAVDAEIYAVEAGTNGGRTFLSLGFIVQG